MAFDFTLEFRDEGHLRAHAAHFLVPLDQALSWAQGQLAAQPSREGWAHFDFEAPQVTGRSGLRRLWPWTRRAFWAPRRGRTIVSHLIVGVQRPTRRLCVWGFWKDSSTFVLHTVYPGRAAPREIHDPELARGDVAASVKFWTRHAILVAPGEWES